MNIFICDVCSKEFTSKQAFGGHKSAAHKEGPRYFKKRNLKVNKQNGENLRCKFCGDVRKNLNSLRNHERCCPSNYNRNYKNGMLGKKGSNQFIKSKELGLPIPEGTMKGKEGTFKGKKHSKEAKQKISEKLSVNNKGGRCKWFVVSGQKVQGTWERDIAIKLNQMNIKWVKLTLNKDVIKYEMGGKIRSYTPDFYLPDFDIFLEIKGFWWGDDKEKMDHVIEQHKDKKIIVIEKNEFNKIMGGELVW